MAPTFTRFGEYSISKITQYEYQAGEVGVDVPIKLDEEARAKLEEFVKDMFGEDAYIMGDTRYAVAVFSIGSKKRRKEYGEKLLAEGREAEAKFYLDDNNAR